MTPSLALHLPLFAEADYYGALSLTSRTTLAIIVGAFGLTMLVPRRFKYGHTIGGVLAIIALGLFGSDLPLLRDWTAQSVFWVLGAVTLGAAVGTISAKSPVHAAIWFALSLLGSAGLFFFQGSQFLGVSTIIVYAGAIVVTFLFVIMLAQPEGHATYDRISWGWYPKAFSVLAAATMVAVLTMLLSGLKEQAILANNSTAIPTAAEVESAELSADPAPNPVLVDDHMGALGGYLFSRHLVSIELAGTLLLAALVGAVAIAIHGKPKSQIEEALR